MPLASSGTLSINDIAGEFGGSSNPESLSEFYRGGSRVPNSPANSSIPTSGTIAISNFYNGSSASDIITGTVFQTVYGSGKNIQFVGGIRPTTTNWMFNYPSSFAPTTQPNIPAGGSWSDNLAESSGVTIESHYSTGNTFVATTRLTSNNLSALVGKTASCTFTGIAFMATTATVQTLTATQSGDYQAIGVTIPNNNVVNSFSLLNCTNGTSYTQSWT
jgi:hypothetical protein